MSGILSFKDELVLSSWKKSNQVNSVSQHSVTSEREVDFHRIVVHEHSVSDHDCSINYTGLPFTYIL